MKTSSYSSRKVQENFNKFFEKADIKRIAKKTGFIERKAKKIDAFPFVMGLILSFCNRKNTLEFWARQIQKLSGKKVSKQALFKRIGVKTVDFCKDLLQEAVSKKAKEIKKLQIFKSFKRVLLHDSTTVPLDDRLVEEFPGNRTNGVQKAIVRIQTIIDLKTMRFLSFLLSGFTRNDQAASGDILSMCSKGDLVIRDLGYFALATFKEVAVQGAHFLSRLRFGVKIYDLSGAEIALASLLKNKQGIDRQVLIGEKKVPVRLVMVPLPKDIAAEKKRKAKQDRDRRLNHSEEYYKWLEFNTYVTTVDEHIWSTEDVVNAYRVRWQIEIIFKSWKTGGLCMEQLIHDRCTNPHRIKVCLYIMLLFVTLFCKKLCLPVLNKMDTLKDNKIISLTKLFSWVCQNIIEVIALNQRKFIKLAFDHCCYEKRIKRQNMMQTILKCSS